MALFFTEVGSYQNFSITGDVMTLSGSGSTADVLARDVACFNNTAAFILEKTSPTTLVLDSAAFDGNSGSGASFLRLTSVSPAKLLFVKAPVTGTYQGRSGTSGGFDGANGSVLLTATADFVSGQSYVGQYLTIDDSPDVTTRIMGQDLVPDDNGFVRFYVAAAFGDLPVAGGENAVVIGGDDTADGLDTVGLAITAVDLLRYHPGGEGEHFLAATYLMEGTNLEVALETDTIDLGASTADVRPGALVNLDLVQRIVVSVAGDTVTVSEAVPADTYAVWNVQNPSFLELPYSPTIEGEGRYIALLEDTGDEEYDIGQGLFRIIAKPSNFAVQIDLGSQQVQDLLELVGITLGYPNAGVETVDSAYITSTGPKATKDAASRDHVLGDETAIVKLRGDAGDITEDRYTVNSGTGDELTWVYEIAGGGGAGGLVM